MSPLSIDPLGVASFIKELLSNGNQWRVERLRKRRALQEVGGFVSLSKKLSHQEKRRIQELLKVDKKLRQCVSSPKRIGDLQKHLLQSSVDEPALGKIAEPLCQLVEALAVEEYASVGEGLIHERVLEQTVTQSETVNLLREQRELLKRHDKWENDPLGGMQDIAHNKLRGYGIQAISINPDTKRSSIILDKPGQLTLRGTGPTAQKLQQLQEAVLTGEVVSLEFTPEDDLHVSINPPTMERFISLNFSKIEVKPTPQVIEQVIRYTVGSFSKAISTQVIFDRAAKLFTLRLKTQQPSLKFEIWWNDKGKEGNFNMSVSTEDGQRPSISDLSVLHLISHLKDERNLLNLVDEGSGGQFASIDLSSSQPRESLVYLSDLAYLTALYLEANYELRRAQLADENLPWPADDDWNDPERKLISLLERIREVLRYGNQVSSISGKATLVEIYDDAPDVIIQNGILEGNMTMSEVVSFGEQSRFTQNFTFDSPRIKLWQDNKELKVKSIREAFATYGAPITLELQSDQTIVTFAKEH